MKKTTSITLISAIVLSFIVMANPTRLKNTRLYNEHKRLIQNYNGGFGSPETYVNFTNAYNQTNGSPVLEDFTTFAQIENPVTPLYTPTEIQQDSTCRVVKEYPWMYNASTFTFDVLASMSVVNSNDKSALQLWALNSLTQIEFDLYELRGAFWIGTTLSPGNARQINLMPVIAGIFYDIKVILYNSNFTYHLWINNTDLGHYNYDYGFVKRPAGILNFDNSIGIVTFKNLHVTLEKTYININKAFSIAFDIFLAQCDALAGTYFKAFFNGLEFLPWEQYTGPFTPGSIPNGTLAVQYCSIDTYGNNGSLRTTNVYSDRNAPSTTLDVSPMYNGYVTNASLAILTANDGHGESAVDQTWYSIAALIGSNWVYTPWSRYSAPFTVSVPSGSIVQFGYCSWDNAGNNETKTFSLQFTFDTPPVTTINYTPASLPNFVTSSTLFTLNATDISSGVNSTWYRYPGLGWTRYTTPFTLAHANHTGYMEIQYYSNDAVGNDEHVNKLTVYLYAIFNVDVYMNFYGLDGIESVFNDVKTFVDGKRTLNSDLRFLASCNFNLTVQDYFNTTIYSRIFNTNTTGTYLDIQLPIAPVKFIDNHDEPVIVKITQGKVTLTFMIGQGANISIDMALGNYYVLDFYVNGSQADPGRELMFSQADPSSLVVNFGPVQPWIMQDYRFNWMNQVLNLIAIGIGIGFQVTTTQRLIKRRDKKKGVGVGRGKAG